MAKLKGNLYPRTIATNETGTALTWNQRKNYSDLVFTENLIINMVDFWGKDKYYGRISPTGFPMRIRKSSLKQLEFSEEGKTLYAINFVADAWKDLVRSIQDLFVSGAIRSESPYANISAVKGWVSPENSYHEYLTSIIYPGITDNLLTEMRFKREVKDFKGFLRVMGYYSKTLSGLGPLTLSGYLESEWTSPHVSGLCISLSDDNHDVDFLKCDRYVHDESFKLFARKAYEHGFMIDRNAPWRLVADLNSPIMQEYMRGINNQPEITPPASNRDECGDLIPPVETVEIEKFGLSEIVEGLVRRAPGYQEFGNKNLFPRSTAVLANTFDRVQNVLFNSNSYYASTSEKDMEILKLYFLDFYNAFVDEHEIYSDYEELFDTPGNTGKATNSTGGVVEVEEEDSVYIPGIESCSTLLRTKIISRKKISSAVFNLETGAYGYKWMLNFHYTLRKLERGDKDSKEAKRNNLRYLYNIYYNRGQNRDAFLEALRIYRTTMLGSISGLVGEESDQPRQTFEIQNNSQFSSQTLSNY